MSVLGSIMNAIFPGLGHRGGPAQPSGPAQTAQPSTSASVGAPAGQPAPQPAPQPQAAPAQPVNVEQVLTQKAAQKGQQLNWRTSIVDLMKVLDIDSSLENRKALAHELGYTGDTGDSATMNVWLHRKTMEKLAENGGVVPASMKD